MPKSKTFNQAEALKRGRNPAANARFGGGL